MFLLYINDFSTNLFNNVRLFDDDTSLYVIFDKGRIGAANSLTSDLNQLDQWSNQWVVDFILKKTINVNFTSKNTSHPNVKFGNSGPTFELSHNHTHLGLNFQI